MIVPALLLALIATQTKPSNVPTSQPAPLPASAFPVPSQAAASPDYLKWPGFAYLPAGDRTVPDLFPTPGDWSAVQAASSTPDDPAVVPWHLRVFVIRRIDEVERLPDGTLYEEKCSLETPDLARIQRAVNLLASIVKAETDGKLKLIPELSVEPDPIPMHGRSLEETVDDYMLARFNGGAYEADDKVFRGPYGSVVCVHPIPSQKVVNTTLNDTPLSIVSGVGTPGYEADGNFAVTLAGLWLAAIKQHAQESGLPGPLQGVAAVNRMTGLPNPSIFVPNGDWKSLLVGGDLPAEASDANRKLPVLASWEPSPASKLVFRSYEGADNAVSIQNDADHGPVIVYSERGSARSGGLALPNVSGGVIQPSKTPTLSLWAKTSSQDPLAIRFTSPEGASALISLGRDRPGESALPEANFVRDGQWRQIKLNLAQTGLSSIAQIALEPTPNSLEHSKITLGPVEYSFASFAVSADPADPLLTPITPDPDSTDAWARAEWAHSAQESPKLLALLKDPDWFVRLNALQHYIEKPDPTAEPALTENATLAIDGPVSAAAMEALWKLGTDTAKAVVHQVIRTGITEEGKAEAATLIAESKDPSVAPELIALQQARTLPTRLQAVRALEQIPGSAAAIIRTTFIFQSDPELKLAVTRTSDPNDPYQISKLLWTSVNEPFDALRTEADLKLISSNDASARKEGYKGIKDDSISVRLALLRYFQLHPREADRNAIEVAATDRSPRVRAAAAQAQAALPTQAKP